MCAGYGGWLYERGSSVSIFGLSILEKVDLYEGMDEEFRKIFEKFSFTDVAASEVFYCTTKKLIRIRFSVDKAYQTAGVRFEVLCAVNKTEKVEEVAPELLEMSRKRRKFVHLLTFFLWILLGLLSLLCSLESAEHTTKGKMTTLP
ncbi:unnamed protein product [Trifolium pratense]|uniref:Uncharacterized protein n=1 Tax=Trifolium pratense TaxID=57577 RepID=A0ACB0MDJ7_TRIPR|nr:unnamed protein product [Trifolium pratense]